MEHDVRRSFLYFFGWYLVSFVLLLDHISEHKQWDDHPECSRWFGHRDPQSSPPELLEYWQCHHQTQPEEMETAAGRGLITGVLRCIVMLVLPLLTVHSLVLLGGAVLQCHSYRDCHCWAGKWKQVGAITLVLYYKSENTPSTEYMYVCVCVCAVCPLRCCKASRVRVWDWLKKCRSRDWSRPAGGKARTRSHWWRLRWDIRRTCLPGLLLSFCSRYYYILYPEGKERKRKHKSWGWEKKYELMCHPLGGHKMLSDNSNELKTVLYLSLYTCHKDS